MKNSLLLAALFTAAAPAHADPLANWQGTRWLLKSESLIPVSITLVAANNKQLWTNAVQSEAVVTCDKVEPANKKAVIVTCDIDQMALRAVSRYDNPTDVVRENSQAVLDEVTQRMTEAQLQFQVNHKGRITRVEVPGLSARDNRIRESNEILRQIGMDLASGFQLHRNTEWSGQWAERNGNLLRVPTRTPLSLATNTVHAANQVDGRTIVQSQGKGTFTIAYEAQFISGNKTVRNTVQDSAVEGLGSDAEVATTSGKIGAGFSSGETQTTSILPEDRQYSGTLTSVALIDTDTDKVVERVWATIGSPTASTPGSSGGIKVYWNGHLRRLAADEQVTLGTTEMVSAPGQTISGLNAWQPIND